MELKRRRDLTSVSLKQLPLPPLTTLSTNGFSCKIFFFVLPSRESDVVTQQEVYVSYGRMCAFCQMDK